MFRYDGRKGHIEKEMISIIENAKVELFHVYNEKICSVIDGLDNYQFEIK